MKNLIKLLEWAQIALDQRETNKLIELLDRWGICNEDDAAIKLNEMNKGIFRFWDEGVERSEFRAAIQNLLHNGYPFFTPSQITLNITASGTSKDSLPERFRIMSSTHFFFPIKIEAEDGRTWDREEHFKILGDAKLERLREKRTFSLDFNDFQQGTIQKKFQPDSFNMSELFTSPKARTHWYIVWKEEIEQNTLNPLAPPQKDDKLTVFFEYEAPIDERRRPGQIDIASLRDTSFLSPTSRMILTAYDLEVPSNKQMNFFQFDITDRFNEYIPMNPKTSQNENYAFKRNSFLESFRPSHSFSRGNLKKEVLLLKNHEIEKGLYMIYNSRFYQKTISDISNVWAIANKERFCHEFTTNKKISSRTKIFIDALKEAQEYENASSTIQNTVSILQDNPELNSIPHKKLESKVRKTKHRHIDKKR